MILTTTFTLIATGLWIYWPQLERIVPERSVVDSTNVIPVANDVSSQIAVPKSNESMIGDICFVTFPNEAQPIARSVSSAFGPTAVTGYFCEAVDCDNVLLATFSRYNETRFANSDYSPQEIPELAAEAALKPRAGHVVHRKSIAPVNGDWMLELSFSYPAGSTNGNRYPAESTRIQALLKQNQMFMFTVGSAAPVSANAEAQREAFFNSVRYTNQPARESDTEARQDEAKSSTTNSPYQSFLDDTMMTPPRIPNFPELGQPYHRFESGETVHFVQCGNGLPSIKGQSMNMRVYLPAGSSDPQTRKCILIAPAGTNLLTGNDVDAGDYHSEALPYVKAGMVVVLYSLDGSYDRRTESDRKLKEAYTAFNTAGGGLLNGQLAFEFALRRLPMVDPQKIFSAGHSSAGTVSLLLASLEPRLAGCIAYAPICSVEARMSHLLNDPEVLQLLPRLPDFARATSPQSHVSTFQCPVFVFHAMDDSNEPVARTAAFVKLMKAENKTITFIKAARGNHYQSMIDDGIPAAIDWLQQH